MLLGVCRLAGRGDPWLSVSAGALGPWSWGHLCREAPPLLASLAGSLGDALAISRLSRTRLRRRPAALLGSAAPDGLQQRDLAHQVDDVIVEEAAAGAGEVGHR